ncbi:flagellar protein FlgN [Pseudescherichia sp.]|uniref:flagellar protein FlgN n=1 Tax=Pseudescherichia sp. TaxID=2055881 RepID=UPI0028A03185|nr:flagellar protein FlgN [Pseudescherichia sp.]
MSHKLEQVKLLLRGIRTDNDSYRQLHSLLKEQRIGMIRRASDVLLAVNAQIDQRYSALILSTRVRRETLLSLGVTADGSGIAQVFSWLPGEQKTAARQAWQQLEENIAACQRYNEKNGELLTRQHAFVQTFLGLETHFIYHP